MMIGQYALRRAKYMHIRFWLKRYTRLSRGLQLVSSKELSAIFGSAAPGASSMQPCQLTPGCWLLTWESTFTCAPAFLLCQSIARLAVTFPLDAAIRTFRNRNLVSSCLSLSSRSRVAPPLSPYLPDQFLSHRVTGQQQTIKAGRDPASSQVFRTISAVRSSSLLARVRDCVRSTAKLL